MRSYSLYIAQIVWFFVCRGPSLGVTGSWHISWLFQITYICYIWWMLLCYLGLSCWSCLCHLVCLCDCMCVCVSLLPWVYVSGLHCFCLVIALEPLVAQIGKSPTKLWLRTQKFEQIANSTLELMSDCVLSDTFLLCWSANGPGSSVLERKEIEAALLTIGNMYFSWIPFLRVYPHCILVHPS